MKRFVFLTTIVLIGLRFSQAQDNQYPLQLFLGEYTYITDKDKTTEIWEQNADGSISGKTIYEYSGGSFQAETMRLVILDGKLNYCVYLNEQDTENPEGEICFSLKSFENNKFTFENLRHDFPKRILYDFSGFNSIYASVEGDTSSIDFFYNREDTDISYKSKGRIIKLPFENKAGRVIDGVYDYFIVFNGINYFIKTMLPPLNRNGLDKYLDKEVLCNVLLKNGMWDSDDSNVQSRVGKYVILKDISE